MYLFPTCTSKIFHNTKWLKEILYTCMMEGKSSKQKNSQQTHLFKMDQGDIQAQLKCTLPFQILPVHFIHTYNKYNYYHNYLPFFYLFATS